MRRVSAATAAMLLGSLLNGCGPMERGETANAVLTANRPDRPPVQLPKTGFIAFEPVVEASGLAQSRIWPNLLWVHNDSGDEARIFPINAAGEIQKPVWMKNYAGIRIPDAVNVDWEDICTDDAGNLIIADLGNNSNMRRDLCLYIVREPYPAETVVTNILTKIPVEYADQHFWPPKKKNFDCEAVFYAGGHVYAITKHRSDTRTKLYRLETMRPNVRNLLTRVSTFDIDGSVTSADVSRDGRQLAVLTYKAVWLFTAPEGSDNYFAGQASWLPISAGKCEAICFYNDQLVIANEERDLYTIAKKSLIGLN